MYVRQEVICRTGAGTTQREAIAMDFTLVDDILTTIFALHTDSSLADYFLKRDAQLNIPDIEKLEVRHKPVT